MTTQFGLKIICTIDGEHTNINVKSEPEAMSIDTVVFLLEWAKKEAIRKWEKVSVTDEGMGEFKK